MITINAICRRNLIYRFHNGLLVILLMSFWLMFHILSFNTFTKQSQRDVVEENVNVSNAIIMSMVPQVNTSFRDSSSFIFFKRFSISCLDISYYVFICTRERVHTRNAISMI